MSKPGSAFDADSVFAKRARASAESAHTDRDASREVLGQQTPDADMLDVVQKFERVYAELDTQKPAPDRPLAHDLPRIEAIDNDGASPSRDTRETPGEASPIVDPTALEPRALPLEQFEFPDADVVPRRIELARDAIYVSADDDVPRRLWPKALAGAGVALVVGIALGYLFGPNLDTSVSGAKIEASEQGGTRLRIDSRLPE